MTDIQVKYWDYKEGKRHNFAQEGETNRHNLATELQAAKELVEVNRHNRVTEGETNRHNRRTEAIDQHKADSQRITANSTAAKNYAEADYTKGAKTDYTRAQRDNIKAITWDQNRSNQIRKDYALAEEIGFTLQPVGSISNILFGGGGAAATAAKVPKFSHPVGFSPTITIN